MCGTASESAARRRIGQMSKLLPFPAARARRPSKFGYARVRKRDRKDRGQLDLFAAGGGKLIEFPAAGGPGPFEEALALEDGGDEAAARRLYEKAVAAGDSVPDAYCNLGVIESKAGGVERAFHCFRNALKHDQQHWESHYNLANLYFDTEEFPARPRPLRAGRGDRAGVPQHLLQPRPGAGDRRGVRAGHRRPFALPEARPRQRGGGGRGSTGTSEALPGTAGLSPYRAVGGRLFEVAVAGGSTSIPVSGYAS